MNQVSLDIFPNEVRIFLGCHALGDSFLSFILNPIMQHAPVACLPFFNVSLCEITLSVCFLLGTKIGCRAFHRECSSYQLIE